MEFWWFNTLIGENDSSCSVDPCPLMVNSTLPTWLWISTKLKISC